MIVAFLESKFWRYRNSFSLYLRSSLLSIFDKQILQRLLAKIREEKKKQENKKEHFNNKDTFNLVYCFSYRDILIISNKHGFENIDH